MTSEKNPWRTVSSSEVYRNPWIRVREDQVICPDGKPGIYGVVETKVATGVLALDGRDLILVGQYRYAIGEYSWEIIEGAAERGEEPMVAAKRELEEEAGIAAAEWRPLGGELHLSNCLSNERAYLFAAAGLSSVPSNPEGTEVLTIRKVPFVDALRMVANNEIRDALSIVGILWLAREMNL